MEQKSLSQDALTLEKCLTPEGCLITGKLTLFGLKQILGPAHHVELIREYCKFFKEMISLLPQKKLSSFLQLCEKLDQLAASPLPGKKVHHDFVRAGHWQDLVRDYCRAHSELEKLSMQVPESPEG